MLAHFWKERSVGARQDFLAYYTTWYHPAKVTILAVGDAPVDTLVAAISKHFGAWPREGPGPADQDYGITPYSAQHAIVRQTPTDDCHCRNDVDPAA
jgi:predicted Zn-dependent peptidase